MDAATMEAPNVKRQRGERGKGRPRDAAIWSSLGKVFASILKGGGNAVIDPETGKPCLDGHGNVIRNPPSAAQLREARAWAAETARLRELGKLDPITGERKSGPANGESWLLEEARRRSAAGKLNGQEQSK